MIRNLKKLTWPIIRFWRWTLYQCLVCGRSGMRTPPHFHWRYCSCECAAYDGALKNPMKSWILFGTVMSPKPHHEWRD